MWDFDKLFQKGNVILLKNIKRDTIFPFVADDTLNFAEWAESYKNKNLSREDVCVKEKIGDKEHLYYTDFEIIKILRYNNEGNAEIVFDRKKDMLNIIPELKNGIFGVCGDIYKNTLYPFVIVDDTVVYQDGECEPVDCLINRTKMNCWNSDVILKIFSDKCKSFKLVGDTNEVIWVNPNYENR